VILIRGDPVQIGASDQHGINATRQKARAYDLHGHAMAVAGGTGSARALGQKPLPLPTAIHREHPLRLHPYILSSAARLCGDDFPIPAAVDPALLGGHSPRRLPANKGAGADDRPTLLFAPRDPA